ncbi:MAG: protein BatD, partial [Lentimicrobiaceae bacterium]|nr:protein BatD [Lentimicrobiaceae bacterium]
IKMNVQLRLAEKPFFLSPTYWVGLFSPICLLIIVIILLRKRIENQKNRAAVRDKRASKLAKKRLNKAEKLLKNKQDTGFYVEISQALWGYVSDKFRIPLGQLSLDTAYQKLKERNMEEASIGEFLETLNQCEQVRFAPSSEITPEKMYERTFNFITKIERELKK